MSPKLLSYMLSGFTPMVIQYKGLPLSGMGFRRGSKLFFRDMKGLFLTLEIV